MVLGSLAKSLFKLVVETVECAKDFGKDNGFGTDIVWARSLESGMKIGEHHRKPVMVIIHKSWCKACKNLKPKFANSEEIRELSKQFVMVNLVDDEEPDNSKFAPDGTYIPRIIFLSPNGRIDTTITNEDGSIQHKYFYNRPEQIAKAMRKALEKYKVTEENDYINKTPKNEYKKTILDEIVLEDPDL